jgi:hypothetical protein
VKWAEVYGIRHCTPAGATQLTFILVLRWLSWEAVVSQATFSLPCSIGLGLVCILVFWVCSRGLCEMVGG